MIWKKVKAIDEDTIKEALEHTCKESKLRVELLYADLWAKHSKNSKTDKRKESLWELIKIYYYFLESEHIDKDCQAYLDTAHNMLFEGGLIMNKTAGLPTEQLVNLSIERLVKVALEEVYPDDKIELNITEGQDFGVDLVWNDVKYDVKTARQTRFLTKSSSLGIIKSYALRDPSKHTQNILWTANMLDRGLLGIVGTDKWIDVVDEIDLGDLWTDFRYSGLTMYSKQIKHFNKENLLPYHMINVDKETEEQILKRLKVIWDDSQYTDIEISE